MLWEFHPFLNCLFWLQTKHTLPVHCLRTRVLPASGWEGDEIKRILPRESILSESQADTLSNQASSLPLHVLTFEEFLQTHPTSRSFPGGGQVVRKTSSRAALIPAPRHLSLRDLAWAEGMGMSAFIRAKRTESYSAAARFPPLCRAAQGQLSDTRLQGRTTCGPSAPPGRHVTSPGAVPASRARQPLRPTASVSGWESGSVSKLPPAHSMCEQV